MDTQRRKFLGWSSAFLPAIVVAAQIKTGFADGVLKDNSVEDLWDLFARIKTGSADTFSQEISKLNGQWAELGGFLSDTANSSASGHKYLLSRQPISCCVDCCIFGHLPFVLVDTQSKMTSNMKYVTIKGRLTLIDNKASTSFHMKEAQIA